MELNGEVLLNKIKNQAAQLAMFDIEIAHLNEKLKAYEEQPELPLESVVED
tara:strand:- start:435 stop:587 length:153 start_codon:yes stop_codon:yes gene_type:complete